MLQHVALAFVLLPLDDQDALRSVVQTLLGYHLAAQLVHLGIGEVYVQLPLDDLVAGEDLGVFGSLRFGFLQFHAGDLPIDGDLAGIGVSP